uniref:Uncharacterized protein n=1 Tax=Romanomermis culicivorax TaxID=13658 RepID=A0A915JK95_ROMCU
EQNNFLRNGLDTDDVIQPPIADLYQINLGSCAPHYVRSFRKFEKTLYTYFEISQLAVSKGTWLNIGQCGFIFSELFSLRNLVHQRAGFKKAVERKREGEK